MADTKMVKTVGEHWVSAALARRGWAPALTRDGLERTDILAVASHLEHRPTVEVQVKTASGSSDTSSWLVGHKAQQPALSQREWFVFVLLPGIPAHPRAFVVPRDHVAAAAWIIHQDWLTDPSAAPGQRNTPVDRARVNVRVWRNYEDRWDLLAVPTPQVPVLLPTWVRKKALEERVGIPQGHPWAKSLPNW